MYQVRTFMKNAVEDGTFGPLTCLEDHNYPGLLVQAVITGDGEVTATVTVQGSLDKQNWHTIDTAMSLSGTDVDSGFVYSVEPWAYVQVLVADLTGTGAAVSAYLGR